MTPSNNTRRRSNRTNVRGASWPLPGAASGIAEGAQLRPKELAAAFLLMLCVVRPADALQLTSDPAAVSLRQGEEATVRIAIRNDEPHMKCIAVEAGTSDERIAVTPTRHSLCVGAKATATLPVTLRMHSGAEPGGYFVEVVLVGDGISAVCEIDVLVSGERNDGVEP